MACGATRANVSSRTFDSNTRNGKTRKCGVKRHGGCCLDQAELLRFIAYAFEHQGVLYAVTGSHASFAYGEQRFTNDIDVVARIQPHQLRGFLGEFPEDQFYISEDGAKYACEHGGQFNIIHPESGLKIDIIIPEKRDWPDELHRRIRLQTAENESAWFIAPEDLILKKMDFYREGGSEKHLRDIAGILKVQKENLDRQYISQWASRLGLSEIWEALLAKAG
jgi:hypothetical protein